MRNPIVNAAEAERSSVVVQVYSGDLENVDGKYITAMTTIALQRFSGPIALQLDHSALTDPDLAVRFVEETGVNALAVSVRTAHGLYSYGPNIEFELLASLIEKV